MHPRVRQVAGHISADTGVPVSRIIGACQRAATVAARRTLIVELWDRSTFGSFSPPSGFRWSISEIGRQLGQDHTTIRHALIRAGVYGPASDDRRAPGPQAKFARQQHWCGR